MFFFFFSSRRRHTSSLRDWSSDVCSSDLIRDAEDEVRRNLRLPRHAVDLVTRGEALRGLNDRVYRIIIAPSIRQNGRNTTSDTLNQLRYLEACRAVHRATDE